MKTTRWYCVALTLALGCAEPPDAGEDMTTTMPDMSTTPDMPVDPPDDMTTEPDQTTPDVTPDMPVDPPDMDPPSGCDPADEGSEQAPVALADGAARAGNACAQDLDWYTVAAGLGCRIDATVTGGAELGVWRENGDAAVAPSAESVRFTVPRAGESVRLRVSASADALYEITASVTCPDEPLMCPSDDLFEDNNDTSAGDNPARVTPGDAFSASMCAAGSNPFERYDYYTIKEVSRYQGCVLGSRLTWPVTPQTGERSERRNYYRNQENLELQHSLGEVFGGPGPFQEVLRATWRLGDVDPDVAPFFELPTWRVISDIEPSSYLDPELDFVPPRTHWLYQRATYFMYPTDYHVRVANAAYSQDGSAVVSKYDVDVRALCDFSCTQRDGDDFFGITQGDDWYDAYEGVGGGLGPDVAFDQGGRLGGLVRGIACVDSPYNGYVDGPIDNRQFIKHPRDIDVVTASSFGKGYVGGQAQGNQACTAVMRVEWTGSKPLMAWTSPWDNPEQKVWSWDARVSTTNEASNPFFAHSSPAAAFSAGGWFDTPPTGFAHEEGEGWAEVSATPALFSGPTSVVVVQVALATAPGDEATGTPWSVRYYCKEDGLP